MDCPLTVTLRGEGESEQDSRSKEKREGVGPVKKTRERDAPRIEIVFFWEGEEDKIEQWQSYLPEAQSGGYNRRAPPTPPVTVCGNGVTQGTRKCKRRARKRLRCIETKLAALLGCRSHQWKMQTSSPNISSGKTRLVLFYIYISKELRLLLDAKVLIHIIMKE